MTTFADVPDLKLVLMPALDRLSNQLLETLAKLSTIQVKIASTYSNLYVAVLRLYICRLVIQRADDRCEYCYLSQADNLALACVSCSLRKGARQTVEDAETGEVLPIFNPRQQVWKEHFRWDGVRVFGLTARGRASIDALNMNRAIMLAIRSEEELLGRHPPP